MEGRDGRGYSSNSKDVSKKARKPTAAMRSVCMEECHTAATARMPAKKQRNQQQPCGVCVWRDAMVEGTATAARMPAKKQENQQQPCGVFVWRDAMIEGTAATARMPAKQGNQQQQECEQGGSPAAVGTLATARMPAKQGNQQQPCGVFVWTDVMVEGTAATARMPAKKQENQQQP
jgi:hypothetical protein